MSGICAALHLLHKEYFAYSSLRNDKVAYDWVLLFVYLHYNLRHDFIRLKDYA